MSSVIGGGAVRFVFGLGMGLVVAPATESIMGSVPRARAGVGSAVNDTTRQTGGALGVAVIGSIFALRYHSTIRVPDGVPGRFRPEVHDSIGKALKAVGDWARPAHGKPDPERLRLAKEVHDAASTAFLNGMRTAVVVGAAFMGLAAFVAYKYLPARAPVEVEPGADERLVEAEGSLAAVDDGLLI
jgi:hypothetical protein